MGNLIAQSQKLYTYKWHPLKANDVFVDVPNLATIPQPLHGKILIPFTQIQGNQQFINQNHHKIVLINDLDELKPFLFFKFQGVPISRQEQLLKQPENCLKMHFNCKYCPIPLILEHFDQNLLSNYINAFYVYGINVQYYERLQIFLKAECQIPLIVCSNHQLQQLSQKIQNLTYRNQTKKKLTILCFCNKEQYTFPKKTQLVMQSCNIQVLLYQNLLEIIQKIRKDSLQSPFSIPQKSQKILFYVDQKEKQVNYLSKMAKRIEKSIRYLKVQKIVNKNQLIQQIKSNQHSIVVIGKDSKQMRNYIEIQESLEEEGLEDRVIFIRRDAQFNDKLIQKIQNVTANPKYVRYSILEKHLIFYGTLDNFKTVLKYFPKLSFKKFIDSSSNKQSIKAFLGITTEVVMTHLRLCDCTQKWKDQIKCRIILVKTRSNTHLKDSQKKETKGCLKEYWFSKEEELINAFQQSNQQLYGVNFNFKSKKMAYVGDVISEIFTKFKEKKNILLNQLFGTAFLFSCEYYFFDQITNYVLKYFSSKSLGNFDKLCNFQHLKYKLYQELIQLHKSTGIQEEVIRLLEKDNSSNVFQLADRFIQWVTKNQILLGQINNIWELFIYRDRPQYLSNCNVVLFFLLLAYNKTSFVQYHNQTFQNITLRIKNGLVSCDREAQNTFSSKIKSSYVYSFSFLLCQEVKPDAIQQPGEIFIRIDGSQLNNFGLFLPIWRNESSFLIAPLTKFQISTKLQLLRLKISLSTQQKMLERFTQYFLEEKTGLRLFKQERQMRKLDCFLENMTNSRLQAAGYMLNKLVIQSTMKNSDLINAYMIFHHLKRGQIDQAYEKLRSDKYCQILSNLITSCREGSSVEAAHSSLTNDQKQEYDLKQERNNSLSNDSQPNSAKRSALNLSKAITNQFKLLPPKNKRNPSQIIVPSLNIQKGRSRRYPVSIKYNRGKDQQIRQSIDNTNKKSQQRQVKIKILPAPDQNLISLDNSKQNEEFFNSTNSHKNFDKKSIKEVFHCSLSRLNSNSFHSQISQFIQFDDPIIQSDESLSPSKRITSTKKDFRFKLSNYLALESSEIENKKTQQAQPGTATSTGKFNFQHKKSQQVEGQELLEASGEGEEQKVSLMEPVLEQEVQKHSDSQGQSREKQTQTDFFRFSLGVRTPGKSLFHIKKKIQQLPRDSIKLVLSNGGNLLQPQLLNIEEESLLLNSNQNILLSSTSFKQSQSNKENAELRRTNEKKLFTFCKNQHLASTDLGNRLKQPHLLILKEQSLVFSSDSLSKCKKEESCSSKRQLFSMFDQERISQKSSTSSIDLQEAAEPVHPQEFIRLNS